MSKDHNPYASMFAAANDHYHALRSLQENGPFMHIAALAYQSLAPNASEAEVAAAFVTAANRVNAAIDIAQGSTPNRDARYLLRGTGNLATAPQLAMHRPAALPVETAFPLPIHLPAAAMLEQQ